MGSPPPSLSPVKAPLPTLSPVGAPTPSLEFWAVCPKRGECDMEDTVSETSKWHAVRCCSDEAKAGWKKKSGCDVWGRSLLDKTCALDESHSFAESVCEDAGARLCTKEELVAECTAETECGADNTLVWSSSPAAQGPTVSPTSRTSGIVTPAPIVSTPAPVASTPAPVASTPAPTTSPSLVPT